MIRRRNRKARERVRFRGPLANSYPGGRHRIAGRARLQEPHIDTWLAGDGPALPSEPIGAAVRRGAAA